MSYLHIAVVFKASNLNYGEGIGNILSLKKIAVGGKNYSYISRQALRYDIVKMLKSMYQYEFAKVDKESGVVQFSEDTTITDYPEIDLFGYMKTTDSNKIRKAIVRLTDATSLEAFHNEIDFATNKGLADRIPNNIGNDIFQAEIHKAHYSYTLTCNLDDIGKDEVYKIEIPQQEKTKRIHALLDVIKLLYRDIRGKRENLSPLFVIGGVYDVGNPFFYNRLKIAFTKDKVLLDTNMLNSVVKIKTFDNTVGEQTSVGYIEGEFNNVEMINVKNKTDIETFFENLKAKIQRNYGSK
ncbi:MAG: type I-B CRISPR-associated protein Cas7/Cst2/DevR [Desulfobacterales bacterium]|nr:type I-B CRISPR-associated protein Cas7/Cst2/DevR [Desulfobacterales bacterium]